MEDYMIQSKLDEFDRRISQLENSLQPNNPWDNSESKFDDLERKIQDKQFTIDDLKNRSNSF